LLKNLDVDGFENSSVAGTFVLTGVKAITSANRCLMFVRDSKFSYIYKVEYGLSENLDLLKDKFVVSKKSETNIFKTMLDNELDITPADISKLGAKSLPTHFKDLMPEAKAVVLLPIKKGGDVPAFIYLDWVIPGPLPAEEVALYTSLRDKLVRYF
jgi:hypothetical protein